MSPFVFQEGCYSCKVLSSSSSTSSVRCPDGGWGWEVRRKYSKNFLLSSSYKGEKYFPKLWSRFAHTSHWLTLGLMSIPGSVPNKWECDYLGPILHGWQPTMSYRRQIIICSTLEQKTNFCNTLPHLERREVLK